MMARWSPLLLSLGLLGGCPKLALDDAAGCCTCAAERQTNGERTGLGDANCLPDDDETTRGVAAAEEQACAAGAGNSISEDEHAVFLEPECLTAPHPCAEICANANAAGARFEPAGSPVVAP